MRNLVLSTDKINDLSICPRLYYFKHILKRVAPVKPKYFTEGEYFHLVLKYYYEDIVKRRKQGPKFYLEIARNIATKFEELSINDSEELISTLLEYLIFYNDDTWEILGAEQPFAKVILEDERADLRVVVRGKADLIINNKLGDQSFKTVVDHKVVSENWPQLSRNNQNLCYVWAFECRDFILNSIGKQKSYKPEKKFIRHPFSYGDHQIEEWKESVIAAIFDLVRYFDMNYYPARFTSCASKFNKKCTYYDVCETTPDNWKYKLESYAIREDIDIMEEAKSD